MDQYRVLKTVMYDRITIPPASELDDENRTTERAIFRREPCRFAEFADSAKNTQAAYQVIWGYCSRFLSK